MTLRQWLNEQIRVNAVDYTYYGKDGEAQYGFESVEAIKQGNWDIPSDLLDCEILKAETEYIEEDDEVIAYVDVISD